jgi:hypothetical protein
MNLPRDIIIHILSYIDNETIKNIEMPYDYYKQYLVSRFIKTLNQMVLNYCIPQIYGEAQGYIKYKNDVSTLAVPIDRPVSTYTNNSLELKKWF